MSEVTITLDGYTLPSGFIPKELTVLFSNQEFNHYLFKPPIDRHLTEVDKRTIRYTVRCLSGISYHDGDVAVEYLQQILSRYCDYTIYTYSDVAYKLLQEMLPTTVIINIQETGFIMPKMLPDTGCSRIHHNPRYCSKSKAFAVQRYLES